MYFIHAAAPHPPPLFSSNFDFISEAQRLELPTGDGRYIHAARSGRSRFWVSARWHSQVVGQKVGLQVSPCLAPSALIRISAPAGNRRASSCCSCRHRLIGVCPWPLTQTLRAYYTVLPVLALAAAGEG